MGLLLGIDTGGTYTDAVLLDRDLHVDSAAKALTTRHDLSVGINQALDQVLADRGEQVVLVGLSTTLATNALVEGLGSPICLLLVGYRPEALDRESLRRALGDDPVCFIEGGHDAHGRELAVLNHAALRRAVAQYAPRVSAFAVSSQFAVRNPAHELAAMAVIRECSGLPVSCGHQLSFALNAPRRALTAALNARLIPLITGLIAAVREILNLRGVSAPLMVVKGDGSLVSEQVARLAPVETILSGPAASVLGARHLGEVNDGMVVDMGGTTTDVAILVRGQPSLSEEGATVGGWRTMVEAIRVHTFGLGGDSEVRALAGEGVEIGPRRVVPLCALAHQHADVISTLRTQCHARGLPREAGRFALRLGDATPDYRLTPQQQKVWRRLAAGPMALADLLADASLERPMVRLLANGLVHLSAFTPTDAAHALGLQTGWNSEAAALGASLHARQILEAGEAEEFCRKVITKVGSQSARHLATAALEDEGFKLTGATSDSHLVAMAVGFEQAPKLIAPRLTMGLPVVGVGAPAALYLPAAAAHLHTTCKLPTQGAVANAVGAVVGSVVWRVIVRIIPESDDQFRLHTPEGVTTLPSLDEALALGEQCARRLADSGARAAGAEGAEVHFDRRDTVSRNDLGLSLLLESSLTATAIGRPRLVER